MKKNIKVGLYFQSLSRKGGGAEKNIIWLSNELEKNNFDVHLFSWDKKNSKSFYQISKKIKSHKMYDNNILEFDNCTYSLRTDKLTLSKIKKDQKTDNSRFTVKDIEFLGNSVSVTVSDLKKSTLKAHLSDKDFYKHEFAIGQNVSCKWSKTDLHKLKA